MRARSIIAIGAVGVGLVACADLLGFKDLEEGDGAAPDVNVPDTKADVDSCKHTTVPAQPTTNDGTQSPGDLTFAIRHVYFTSSPDGGAPSAGYDLDNHCTTDLASSSCIPASGSPTIDQTGGIDDESVSLLNTLITAQPSLAGSLSDPSLNAAVAAGDFTILLRLYGYKGGANQTSSSGISLGAQSSPGPTSLPPSFDGGDRWFPAADDTTGGLEGGTNFPSQLSSNVYVTNNILVATYTTSVTLRLIVPTGSSISGPLIVILTHPVLTGRIVARGDGRYDLVDGVVAGRWAANDMLRAIAPLKISGGPLCDFLGGSVYPILSTSVCGARDINAAGNDDGTHACDGLSVALAFDAVAASVTNAPAPFPTSTTPCADAGVCPN